ncbi:MAG: aminotransferase class I/II-fold pyridoxal phosphate-dependent enzyme, partial [Candidatus Omnitrophica bacterium]|nr:aminotransferase class I/II-fold pyridoxal phosphate-dependent enzyme [Candidatus Omnitrophota bacterium]
VNTIAQAAAALFIKDGKFIKKSITLNTAERDYLYRGLRAINGLKVFEPASNFILCRIRDNKLNSAKLADILGRQGILIRDCGNFRGLSGKFIRVAVKNHRDNAKLLKALKWLKR